MATATKNKGTTETQDLVKTLEQGRKQMAAESIISDRPHRCPEAIAAGDAHRQGDIYITYLGRELPSDMPKRSLDVQKAPTLQLAPGNNPGSRHCLDSLDGVTVYNRKNAGAYDGPVLFIGKDQERSIVHPDHGDFTHMVEGYYNISYQRTGETEEAQRRVQD